MEDNSIDRISSLPNPILEHILSFLSTKQVLQTCILSKRWRNTWASVTVLEFDLKEFLITVPLGYERFLWCKRSFEQFVDYVLDNREPMQLDRFKLKWRSGSFWGDDPELLIKWLDCVVLLKPKLVHIDIDAYLPPDSLFNCESIQNLQLLLRKACNEATTKTKSINLPYLKCLKLGNVRLNDDFKMMLFQGCPLLEDLVLDCCELDLSEISSKKLKELAMTACYQIGNLNISCPSLVSLVMERCFGQKGEGLSVSYMPSLKNADISFFGLSNYDTLKILRSCSNATGLTFVLNNLPFKVEQAIDQFKTFDNLKRLIIQSWYTNTSANFALLVYFLRHSPHLQELTLKCWTWTYPMEEEIDWKESSKDIFLREYLDTVIIIEAINNMDIDLLLKSLRACVRTIGKIIVIPAANWC